MKKQDKGIYGSLMNRIAVAMMINQGALLVLATALGIAESLLLGLFGDTELIDAIMRTGECIVYFVSFTLPTTFPTPDKSHSLLHLLQTVTGASKSNPTELLH